MIDPDTCRAGCECCLVVSTIISKLNYKKLFSPVILNSSRKDVSTSDVYSHHDASEFAVTVNIQPTKRMNGKQWRLYTPEKQVAILRRVEASFRRKNPSVELIEMHFESCPILRQMHFHALYKMTTQMVDHYALHFDRICGSTGFQTNPWRTLDIKPITNMQGWLRYIRKGETDQE